MDAAHGSPACHREVTPAGQHSGAIAKPYGPPAGTLAGRHMFGTRLRETSLDTQADQVDVQ
jgi:hypothetical protein